MTRLVLGLTEIVERLAEFVGPSKNDVPVEYVVPQIIGEVNTTEESLALVTEVLLILQVSGIPHKSRLVHLHSRSLKSARMELVSGKAQVNSGAV